MNFPLKWSGSAVTVTMGCWGLQALTGRSWDVCVDVGGYTPRQVRPSAERLSASVKRYVFVSAVSVYGDPDDRSVRETHPTVPPASEDVTEVNGETYGALKVACENIVQQVYADRCTLLRPQVAVGPHDPSGRYSYWVQRAIQGGEMLAPGDDADHVQMIDVRDLAQFARMVIENDLGGVFNLAGPRLTWAEFMNVLGAKNIVWVATEIIKSAGLTFLELPLFRSEGGPRSSLMDVSNERARTVGLTLTDPRSHSEGHAGVDPWEGPDPRAFARARGRVDQNRSAPGWVNSGECFTALWLITPSTIIGDRAS